MPSPPATVPQQPINKDYLLVGLKPLSIWSPSQTKRGQSKAPHFNIDAPTSHATYDKALQVQQQLNSHTPDSSKFIGIMPSLDDPYIIFDVDIDPKGNPLETKKQTEITETLLLLLERFPTYTEISPSGHGLHIIFKLKARDHETFKALKYTRSTSHSLSAPFTGEIIFSNTYLIITQNVFSHPSNPSLKLDDIASISLEELLLFAPTLQRKLQPRKSNVTSISTRQRVSKVPDINDMRDRLELLPTSMTVYTQRAYAGLQEPMSPNDYEHWVNVAMCLAHAACQYEDSSIHEEHYTLFDNWSARDKGKYKGPDDTRAKWDDCFDSTRFKLAQGDGWQPIVTKATLHKLINLCNPQYTVLGDKGPIWESTENLRTAIKFHDLAFMADAYNFDTLYVKCHEDVANHLFDESFPKHASGEVEHVVVFLKSTDLAARKVLEKSNYHIPAITKCLAPFKQAAVQEIDFDTNQNVHDRFRAFIDERPWDGKARVQDVINTLHFDPHTASDVRTHYNRGLYKCLLWLVAIRYHGKPASAPTVPILVGGEGIYKSTWVKSLLHGTPFANQYARPISGLLNDRKELSRALQGALIALIDEIETSMKSADKAKDILTEETLSLRAHYVNSYVNVMKRGLVFGTTNNPYMNISDDGNRRLMRITVQHCDTDALWKIDMQQVFAELKHDYLNHLKQGNHMPWVFTKEENRMNNLLAGEAAAVNEETIMLEDYFGGPPESFTFDPEELIGNKKGVKQIDELMGAGLVTTVRRLSNDILEWMQSQNYNANIKQPNLTIIRRKLQAYATKYTDTSHRMLVLGKSGAKILNGQLNIKNRIVFIIPPRRKDTSND